MDLRIAGSRDVSPRVGRRQLARISALLVAAVVAALAISISVVPVPMSSADTPPTGYRLDNGRLRFGEGPGTDFACTNNPATVASVDPLSGLLRQPYYRRADNTWCPLTFSTVRLSMTIGTGTGGGNWSGTNVPSSSGFSGRMGLESLTAGTFSLQVSTWTETARVDGISVGHGTLISTGEVVVNGQAMRIRHEVTLGANDAFVTVRTQLTNLSATPATNVHVWVGTRDDWVGESDSPGKRRGNLVDGAFVQAAATGDQAAAILVESGSEAVLFYSTTTGTDTAVDSCCDFSRAYNRNPSSVAPYTNPSDGSYAIVMPLGDLAAGASGQLDWFYAGGSLAELNDVISDVAEAAGATSDLSLRTDVAATITYEVDVTGSASYMLVPTGSAAPSAAQIVAGAAYGDPAVTPVSTGATPVTGGTPVDIAFTGLSAATGYVAYVVTSYVDAGNPMESEVAEVAFTTRAGAPSVTVTPRSRALDVVVTPGAGVDAVTNYAYSLNGGGSWTALSPASVTGVFSVGGLTNDTEYEVAVRALVGSDDGMPSSTVAATPVRAAQVITFPAVANVTLGTPAFPVSPVASSGLAVTVSSLTDAVCTTVDLVVTVSALGTCTLRAAQDGDADVAPATPVERSFQVSSVPVIVAPPTPATPAPPPTVEAPPARPVAVIAGVPAEVQVRVPAPTPSTPGAPAAPEPTTLEVSAGTVRAEVQVPGAGRVRETTESVAVEVVRDRAGVLAGEGARPGSTVRAVVHTVAGESRPVAQISVNADGSYSGEMVFDGSVDGRPLPIGAHVLRLLAETPAGEELALDVVVEVAQPDPAPERFFASQEIPVAAPGQVLATNAGDPEVVSLEVLPVDGRTVAQADGWSMAVEVAADAGRVAGDGGAARIEIVQDAGAAVAGDGFMPGTRADVWLFSTPVLLGSATIEADGSFSGFVPVDGGSVEVGEHTLQLQGVGADGYVRSLNVGVVVAGPESVGRLPAAGARSGDWLAQWAILLGAIGGLAVLVGGGRRRRLIVNG